MKRTLTIVFICNCFIGLLACSSMRESESEDATKQILFNNNEYYHPRKEEKVLSGNYGKYEAYLAKEDNLIQISSSKLSPLENARIYTYCGSGDTVLTKNNSNEEVFDSRIEFCELDIPNIRLGDELSSRDLSMLFGSKVKVSVKKTIMTKSGESGEVEGKVDLYIPEAIEITSPRIESEKDLYPLCYYDGFVLKWNADGENKNGVIVSITWTGEMVLGKDIPDTYVRRTCILPDNGSAVLDNEMFEGIPDTAVCHMTLLRGDIGSIVIDEELFKVMGDTHEYLSFVLIREIEQASIG